jgi:NAD(P)-dependent dehydrogenase (short-subunit alcohol dehydrogenase family)
MTGGQRFTGRSCVVTAAASGIGARVADQLEHEGARVWRLDRNADRPEIIACDVTSDDDVDDARRTVLAETPSIHHIYHGVGMLPPRLGLNLEQEDLAEWRQVMDTNLYGMLRVLRAFGTAVEHGGSIVTMSSDQSLNPRGDALVYGASKAAVNAVTVGLAKQWVARHVRINALAPGSVRTGLIDAIAGNSERRDAMFAHADTVLPLGLAEPETTAALILFLLSDAARHVTGEVWRCDSGQAMLGIHL